MTNFLCGLILLCALSVSAFSWADQPIVEGHVLRENSDLSTLNDRPYRKVYRSTSPSSPVFENPRLTVDPKPSTRAIVPDGIAFSKVIKQAVAPAQKIAALPPAVLSIPLPAPLSLSPFTDTQLESPAPDYKTQGLILPVQNGPIGALLPNKPDWLWLMTPQRQTQVSLRRVLARLPNLDQSNAEAQEIAIPSTTPTVEKAVEEVITPLITPMPAPN